MQARGPDGDFDNDERWWELGQPFTLGCYDASNGSISNGNIATCGP